MSDPGRKNFSTKVKESITPGIFKSRSEKVKEHTTDNADTAARESQPDSTRGALQAGADKVGRAQDRVVHGTSGPKKKSRNLFGRKKI
ncbi:uncharacterized protein HMPREF1541_00826 [Cyphellophora europaea CBS 101466]|uniref:Uncharacterized protein n=1 Tax=Cyphellophora europaea (strain CBS 101466) TaxID=1220924 RepID=W2SDD5_CYPE1|nr:uncharacterized protein HMPREF1541_00826 [Cyphellophora europaea CBS 101466]ETN46640.1 hypothetical protein HMPREF1541_00826 [Cyphellophora europaea CBS 101466]